MYRTADNLEDLDIIDELLSFETVSHAAENHNIIEDEYRDADVVLYMLDDQSEVDEITDLLKSYGYSAYLEFCDDGVIKVGL